MRRAILILALMIWPTGPGTALARGQSRPNPGSAPTPPEIGKTTTVDGVAARIEDDVITESELRELADQWIVHGEADTAKYPRPPSADVNRAYEQLAGRFASQDEFRGRCTEAGLSEAGVRRMLGEQLYLSRFLDYRFRPAAQISDPQSEAYYHDEFTPEMKKRGEAVPPLDSVAEMIREVLVQRAISERVAQWLDDTRARLKIDVLPGAANP